tara:strand:- start:15422 stop:16249 length:828 start_codon:yes stop_codon:yes gene_type:complete
VKIGLIIGTRGNPHRAAAVVETARALAGGRHEVGFTVSCDDDDAATVQHFTGYPGVDLSVGPRPAGVAEVWNRCIPVLDADIVIALADDGFIATPLWDEVIALIATEGRFPRELLAFALHDTANAGQPTVLGGSREWIKRIGGKLIDDRFPFWFADTAYAETWSFVTGEYLPILPITIASRGGRYNPRLRDMGFWWDFYVATRSERLLLAEQIRRDLGLSLPAGRLRAILDGWEARDRLGRPGAIEIAAALPKREPDDAYLAAYAAARTHMGIAA